MNAREFIVLSYELEDSGLIWHPEIGDEVCARADDQQVSIFVSPQGLTPSELRESFLWLPTLEQLVVQIEAREALLFHAGVSDSFKYETVVKTSAGVIETEAQSLRIAVGKALNSLLNEQLDTSVYH